MNILEAIRFLKLDTRFYNAASSECFGNTGDRPADETTLSMPPIQVPPDRPVNARPLG